MDALPLFDRIPATLFRPLAATNHRHYWAVLCRLFDQLWGDGAGAPGLEIEKAKVIRVIESHLIHDDPWLDDQGQTLDSPVAIRANDIYLTFRDADWLSERQRGVRTVTTVRPIVAQFYEALVEFSERGPNFLGSQVLSIHSNVRLVVEGKADGGSFHEAARQAHTLWTHIANTGVQVYDLMERLQKVGTTREFVEGFFEGYIQKLFIGDYLEIRTSHHPLQHRTEIIHDTLRCSHVEELLGPLHQWYTQKLASGDPARGQRLFDRDVSRLMRLQDVEQHLKRLDDEIRAANQRALTYLEYKARAPRSFDALLAKACKAIRHLPEGHIALPDALPAEPLGPEWWAQPPTPPKENLGTAVIKTPPTLEALALDALRRSMTEARLVTPIKLATYVVRHLGNAHEIGSEDLTIQSIADLACYQRLLLIASRFEAPIAVASEDPFVGMVPGMSVKFVGQTWTRGDYVQHRRFVVHREKRA